MDSKKKPAPEKEVAPGKPKHSVRKIKSFVNLEPTLYTNLKEATDQKLESLIRLGLGDQGRLAFFLKALDDPKSAVRNVNLRDYVGAFAAKILRVILSDDVLYTRVRTILQKGGIRESVRMGSVLEDHFLFKRGKNKKHPRPINDPKTSASPK